MADFFTKVEAGIAFLILACVVYLAWLNRETLRSAWCAIPGTNCQIQVTPGSPTYDVPATNPGPFNPVSPVNGEVVTYPQPDWVYADHPFQGTILDPVYDAGWNFMGWLRGAR